MSVDDLKGDPEIERIVASAKRMAERANVRFELDRGKLKDFPLHRHYEESQDDSQTATNQPPSVLQC